jgi:outer membrane lipoprotein carrier protein
MSARRFAGRRLALGLAFLALSPLAGAQSAVERVDGFLSALHTLRGSFQQEIVDATGAVRDVASGTLAIQKPGRFRWDYQNPSPQLLVSDGRTIWLYDEELEQVTVRKADDTLSATPASLLSGRGKASDRFTVAAGEPRDGLEWTVLTPRLEDTDFREVRLGFRGDALQRMELEDRLGQTTRIAFSDLQRNVELSPDLFTFDPPPGVDVVGSAGGD